MKVHNLIDVLQHCPQDAKVRVAFVKVGYPPEWQPEIDKGEVVVIDFDMDSGACEVEGNRL